MNLNGKKIKDTYPSVVTTASTSGFANGPAVIQDGRGLTGALELGTTNANILGAVKVNGTTVIAA